MSSDGSDGENDNIGRKGQNLANLETEEVNFFNYRDRDSRSSSGYGQQSDGEQPTTSMSLANQLGCMDNNSQLSNHYEQPEQQHDNDWDGLNKQKTQQSQLNSQCKKQETANQGQEIDSKNQQGLAKVQQNKVQEQFVKQIQQQENCQAEQSVEVQQAQEIKSVHEEEKDTQINQPYKSSQPIQSNTKQKQQTNNKLSDANQFRQQKVQTNQSQNKQQIQPQTQQKEPQQQKIQPQIQKQVQTQIQKQISPSQQIQQISPSQQIQQISPSQQIQQQKIEERKLTQESQTPSVTAQQKIKQQNIRVEYQKQLDDDMEMLKKSLKKKKSSKGPPITALKKQQKNDKNKINKTMAPIKVAQFDQNQDIQTMQLKMIAKMAHQKKKENYQLLKQWDKRRAQKLALHRNMIQKLQCEVDKRIKSSIQNLEIYQTFFTQKARQQEKYVSHPIINTRFALQNNSLSKNVYINCSVILNSLSDQNQMRCRRINDFIHLIRTDILKQIIQAHLTTTQRQLLRARQKISTLKNSLRKYNQETEEKTKQLAIFFNQNAVSFNLNTDKDFYAAQLDFIRIASKQTSVQKKLGEYCLEYYNIAVTEQNKRSKVIRDSMVTFTKGLSQCYSVDMDPAEIQQLSKAQETRLISEFYSLDQMFQERLQSIFKANEQIQEHEQLTVSLFQKYLNKFDFEAFDCRLVLLKQFQIKYRIVIKNQPQRLQNCLLVITVDRFIHLFVNNEKIEPYPKPDVSVKVDQKNLEFRSNKDVFIEMIIKDERRTSMLSYFWQAKNDKIYRLEFSKKDSREQFLDYVSKLRA